MPIDLVNPELFKPHVPIAPRHHALFGTKYFKIHNFHDSKWPPQYITEQYLCMVRVLGKNWEYKKFEKLVAKRNQREKLKNLRLVCQDGRKRIKNAYMGDVQRIRNILLHHKDMQRLYQNMPSHLVVGNVNQKTFVKRKENDRLKYRLNLLCNDYKEKTIEASKIEDRIKYQNEFQLQSEVDAKKCEKDLCNSRTRIKALKIISKGYMSILDNLCQDTLFYEPVLEALEKDIKEQTKFIHHIILLGVPVMGKHQILIDDYEKMEKNARQSLSNNLQFVSKSKKALIRDGEQIKKIVRKSTAENGKLRYYTRETTSMINLRNKKETKDKDFKDVQIATCSAQVEDVFPRIQRTTEFNVTLGRELKRNEEMMELLINSEKRSKSMKLSLIHNLSDVQIKRKEIIEHLREKIKVEQEQQQKYDNDIKERGECFNLITLSLWNIIDVLRHVGAPVKDVTRVYPNEELKLELLKFDAKPMEAMAPPGYEVDSSKLLKSATDKITELVKISTAGFSKEDAELSMKELHVQYLASLVAEDEVGPKSEKGQPLFVLASTKPDPNVMTRTQIKVLSVKICEANMKRDDEL